MLSFDPLDPRITPFAAKIRYVVVKDMPQTQDYWQREAWQRNAILRGVPDANDDDLVLISNMDEIPRAATVQDMVRTRETVFSGCSLPPIPFSSITGISLDPSRRSLAPLPRAGWNLRELRRTTCCMMFEMAGFPRASFQTLAGTFRR